MSVKVIQVPTKVWNLAIKVGIIFVVCLLIGIMINFFSPHATLEMDEEERFWFWICLCLVGGAGTFICDFLLTYSEVKWPDLLKAFIQSVCGTVAVLIPLYMTYEPVEIPPFSTTFIFVWAIIVLILIGTFSMGLKLLKPETDTLRPDVKPPKMLDEAPTKILMRLPFHLQTSELYALSAEDHYVRIHTSKGDTLMLMRLSDAILETGMIEGLQIHRSWWVAKAAVEDIKSKGRVAEVTLKNNVKAPVSRNALKTLKSVGWL